MRTFGFRFAASAFRLTLFGAIVIGANPPTARAEGFYTGVQGGAILMYNTNTRATEPAQTFFIPANSAPVQVIPGNSASLSTRADTGWLAGAFGGYEWPIGLALEGEFTFRQNHLNPISENGVNVFTGGDVHSDAMMMNGYYRWHNPTPFTPYIGGGIGESVVVLNNLRPRFGSGDFDGTDATFAYQAIGGISYALTRNVTLAAEYRYFAALEPSFTASTGGVKDVKLSPGYKSSNALLRLSYNF